MESPSSRSASLVAAFERHPDLDTAHALLGKLSGSQPLPPLLAALEHAGLVLSPPEATQRSHPAAETTVARSDIPTALPVDLGLPIATAPAQQAARVAGPFRGPAGSFWLHLFGPPQSYSIYRAGESRPRLVITQGELPLALTRAREIALDGGTVWIAAGLLDASGPDDAFAGFTVSSGTLRFSSTPTVVGRRITIGATAKITLDAMPAAASGAAGPCDVTVSGPAHLRITWRSTGPPAVALGAATVGVAGETFHLDRYVGPPRRDSVLGAIVFPYEIRPASWDAATLRSDLVTFSGTTGLTGGWALSLVPNDGTSLAEALGPGFFLFACTAPLAARWPEADRDLRLTSAILALRQGQVVLGTRHATASGLAVTLRLWAVREEAGAPRIPLTLGVQDGSVFAWVCDAVSGEAIYATCTADLALDRPVTLKGDPLPFSTATLAWFALAHPPSGGTTIRVGAVAGAARGQKAALLALHNALVAVTAPILFFVEGTWSAGWKVDSGGLLLALGAQGWVPTLPDPYVTNQSLFQSERSAPSGGGTPSLLAAIVTWAAPSQPTLGFLGALPAPAGGQAPPTPDPARPVLQAASQIRVPTQTAEGALPADKRVPATHGERSSASSQPEPRGVRLLDVSTKKDLLGVEIAELRRNPSFQLVGLDVCTPADEMRVFALPQVQWEPVRTLDRDQDIALLGHFPTPLASVTDGGATLLGVSTQRLVPAIPDLAVDAILADFAAGAQAVLLTTLPFGLKARLELRPLASADGRNADLAHRNEPDFLQPALHGGAQLAFIAESGPSVRRQSSFFNGTALQLRNGVALATGAPLGISVLGSVVDPADSVQEMFNNEFGPTGHSPRVPVTRLDISGYGGSCFSEWLDRDAAYASAAKVQFQVLVGRTALEVVKIATVLYPWGVLLTRTVTIERQGGGGVIRRDSGWQAASDGLFQFPGTSYHVQPGLLRGLFGIRNLRSTGLPPITFVGHGGRTVVLAPKYFDAAARIDGLEGPAEVAAEGVLGFLQIEPVGEPLDESDLKALLTQQGPVGGPVDGIVNVGASGFRVRATRVEVGLAENAGGHPELVGTIRSAPVFRQDGSWSAVRGPGPSNPHGDAEVINANDVRGLPVVREGELTGVTGSTLHIGPQSDVRFCDAADLHRPDDPTHEYGFLQTSPAHAFLFPRPHIDPGIRELRSRTAPRFADTLARSTSKGLFPPLANAITLPANTLVVNAATGGFRLRDPVNLAAPRPPLILAQRGSDLLQIDYGSATLALSFSETRWDLDMHRLELWTDVGGLTKVSGLRARLVAGTSDRPVLREIESLLKPEIESALTFLPGFSGRPQMGPVDLVATNTQHEIQLSLIVERHWKFGEVPGVKFAVGGKAQIGWTNDDAPPPGGPRTSFAIGLLGYAAVEGKIPLYSVLYLLLGAEIDIGGGAKRDDSGPWEAQFLFEVKAYVGLGIHSGPFDGSLAIGYHLAIENSTVKNGIFGQLQAELDLKILDIGVEGELGGLWYADTTHPPNQHASDTSGEIQVNVELAFIGFHFSIEFTSTDYFR